MFLVKRQEVTSHVSIIKSFNHDKIKINARGPRIANQQGIDNNKTRIICD